MDVGFLDGRARRIAAVAIGASQSHDGLAVNALGVHVAHALMALHAALAFGRGLRFRLPQQIVARGGRQRGRSQRTVLRRRRVPSRLPGNRKALRSANREDQPKSCYALATILASVRRPRLSGRDFTG